MLIDTLGEYVLTEEKRYRVGVTTFILEKGTIIHVNRLDYKNGMFFCDEIGEWKGMEQPVMRLDPEIFQHMSMIYNIPSA